MRITIGRYRARSFWRRLCRAGRRRPVEAKEAANPPQADAVRYMLLKLDANQNAADRERRNAQADCGRSLRSCSERLDNNNNGQLDRQELSRSGPGLAQIAGRYVEARGDRCEDGVGEAGEIAGGGGQPV